MWIWKQPDLKTGEKGVIMFLRIYSYFKWKTKTLQGPVDKVKEKYNFLLGEHLEVTNPRYSGKIKDFYRTEITDFDLWFYSSDISRDWVVKKSKGLAANVPHMKMSAVCYLIDQNFFKPDPIVRKEFDFIVCYNDMLPYKRPEWVMSFFEKYRLFNPNARLAIVYKNTQQNLYNKLYIQARKIGGVCFYRCPSVEQIKNLYNKSRCLLHASETESAPRVIGEAMACGLPVVVAKEPWNASIDHLSNATLILPKLGWKSESGPYSVNKFLDHIKEQQIKPHKLVRTKNFLDTIDNRLSTFNNPWTLGLLNPPIWVGENIIEDKNDRIFTEITGEVLT